MSRTEALTLFRGILRLHRALPAEMRALGNSYVRDEFHRHKDAKPEFVPEFLRQWQQYRVMLRDQIVSNEARLGRPLQQHEVDAMTDQQLGQLYVLKDEAKKPL